MKKFKPEEEICKSDDSSQSLKEKAPFCAHKIQQKHLMSSSSSCNYPLGNIEMKLISNLPRSLKERGSDVYLGSKSRIASFSNSSRRRREGNDGICLQSETNTTFSDASVSQQKNPSNLLRHHSSSGGGGALQILGKSFSVAAVAVVLLFLTLLPVAFSQASSECLSLKGSAFCDSSYGFDEYGIDSNTSSFFTAVQAYFEARTVVDKFQNKGTIVSSVSQFDSAMEDFLKSVKTERLFYGCDVPKKDLQWLRPFLCVWAVQRSTSCQKKSPGPVMCGTSTRQFFESAKKKLNDPKVCPGYSPDVAVARTDALRQVFETSPNVKQYYNAQSSCIGGESQDKYAYCGYSDNETACASGCSSKCSLISAYSPLTIFFIVLAVLLPILLLGLLVILCTMKRANRKFLASNDSDWKMSEADSKRIYAVNSKSNQQSQNQLQNNKVGGSNLTKQHSLSSSYTGKESAAPLPPPVLLSKTNRMPSVKSDSVRDSQLLKDFSTDGTPNIGVPIPGTPFSPKLPGSLGASGSSFGSPSRRDPFDLSPSSKRSSSDGKAGAAFGGATVSGIAAVAALARNNIGKVLHARAQFVPDLPDELAVMEGDRLITREVYSDNWALVDLLSREDPENTSNRNAGTEGSAIVLASGLVPVSVFDPASADASSDGAGPSSSGSNRKGEGMNSSASISGPTKAEVSPASFNSAASSLTPRDF